MSLICFHTTPVFASSIVASVFIVVCWQVCCPGVQVPVTHTFTSFHS